MASSRTDVELMEQARANAVEAFAEVYDRHAPALLALLRRLLGAKVDELADMQVGDEHELAVAGTSDCLVVFFLPSV